MPVTIDQLEKFVVELLRRVAELERQVAVMEGRIAPPPLTLPTRQGR